MEAWSACAWWGVDSTHEWWAHPTLDTLLPSAWPQKSECTGRRVAASDVPRPTEHAPILKGYGRILMTEHSSALNPSRKGFRVLETLLWKQKMIKIRIHRDKYLLFRRFPVILVNNLDRAPTWEIVNKRNNLIRFRDCGFFHLFCIVHSCRHSHIFLLHCSTLQIFIVLTSFDH